MLLALALVTGPGLADTPRPGTLGYGLGLTATPTTGAAPLLVGFHATLTPDTVDANLSWNFGDGGSYAESAHGNVLVAHDYTSLGTFVATVTSVIGSSVETASVAVTVVSPTVTVYVSATPVSGNAPLTIRFAAAIAGGTGTYPNITWHFGDGGEGSGAQLNYTYTGPGLFDASVNVSDSSGNTGSGKVTISVGAAPSDGPSPLGLGGDVGWALELSAVLVAAAGLSLWLFGRRRPPGPASGGGLASTADGQPAAVAVSAIADPLIQRAPSGPPSPEELAVPDPTDRSLDASRRLSERLLVHLYWFGRTDPGGIARVEASQSGMAQRLGVPQNSLSKALRRLVDTGLVRVELQHVPGASRRLKTYSLTPRGELTARSIRKEWSPRS